MTTNVCRRVNGELECGKGKVVSRTEQQQICRREGGELECGKDISTKFQRLLQGYQSLIKTR